MSLTRNIPGFPWSIANTEINRFETKGEGKAYAWLAAGKQNRRSAWTLGESRHIYITYMQLLYIIYFDIVIFADQRTQEDER